MRSFGCAYRHSSPAEQYPYLANHQHSGMRRRLYSCKNSHASPFLHSPLNQCLQTVERRSRSRGCVGSTRGAWKFCEDGVVWRRGQCVGPRGQPAGVSANRHIWSSANEKYVQRMNCADLSLLRTFVKLQIQLCFDIVLCRKVILVKERIDDIPQRARSSERVCSRCHLQYIEMKVLLPRRRWWSKEEIRAPCD